jgi:hypothetical protein
MDDQAKLANQASAGSRITRGRPVFPAEGWKFEADRAPSHVIEVNSPHAVPFTNPDIVADVIKQAALPKEHWLRPANWVIQAPQVAPAKTASAVWFVPAPVWCLYTAACVARSNVKPGMSGGEAI